MKARDYFDLLLLAAVWGASYLFMRFAAPEFGPVPLIAVRVAIASAFLLPLLLFRQGRPGVSALRRDWRGLFALGAVNSALPFCLSAYATLLVTAGYASILNATTSLWGALVAWLWLRDRLSGGGVAGLCLGFGGVVILVVGKTSFAAGGAGPAVAACLLAAFCYGASANFTRRHLPGVDPLRLATGSQLAAMLPLALIALVAWPARPPSLKAWLTVFALGVGGTGVAYLLYFRLIRNVGPTRAISVTYLVPAFGVVWGAIFLHEAVTLPMIAGAVVILLGVGLTTGALSLSPRSIARRLPAILVPVFLAPCVAGQTPVGDNPGDKPHITIRRLHQPPRLDDFARTMEAELEPETEMTRIEGLIDRFPKDGAPISERTVVYLGYDEQNIYAVFVCFDRSPDRIRARLLPRDKLGDDAEDSVALQLDTFHDRKRCYGFQVNPLGVQSDGIWTEGQGWDHSFDTVWSTEGRLTKNGYVVRIAVPFKSLRFTSAEAQNWGILVYRGIPRLNEEAFWPPYSTRVEGRLTQAGELSGLEGISPGRNWQVTPYATFRSARTLDARNQAAPKFESDPAEFQGGVDAKFVIKDSLVLDLTVNPDFSQVESDEPQVTTNQRFEVFFPERRPFFIENASYFNTPINLLFTRRIADPQFGARLTGKLGRYGIGALLIDDRAPGRIFIDDPRLAGRRAMFAVARVNRDLGRNSSLGVIYSRRQFAGSLNQAGGLDGRFRIGQQWAVTTQALASATNNPDGSRAAGPAFLAALQGNGRNWNYKLQYDDKSADFRTDSGFIPRADIRAVAQKFSYRLYPEGKRLLSFGPDIETDHVWDHRGLRLDAGYTARFNVEMVGRTNAAVFATNKHERLRVRDFTALSVNTDFAQTLKGFSLATAFIPQMAAAAQYASGTSINFVPRQNIRPELAKLDSANLTLTARPALSLRVDQTYLWTRLRDRASGAAIFNNHIIRSKWNYQFTRALSLRAIFQYSAVLTNPEFTSLRTRKGFNADLLFAWQLHPGTAAFIGYNSNATSPDPFQLAAGDGSIASRQRFINDGRQLFAKFSWLFRF
jgi:drug/metabolite transporter (DMT)-like permease